VKELFFGSLIGSALTTLLIVFAFLYATRKPSPGRAYKSRIQPPPYPDWRSPRPVSPPPPRKQT
jgi:hypothetical protein